MTQKQKTRQQILAEAKRTGVAVERGESVEAVQAKIDAHHHAKFETVMGGSYQQQAE